MEEVAAELDSKFEDTEKKLIFPILSLVLHLAIAARRTERDGSNILQTITQTFY